MHGSTAAPTGRRLSHLFAVRPSFRVIGSPPIPTHPPHRHCAGRRAGHPWPSRSAFEDEGPARAMLAATPNAASHLRSDRCAPSDSAGAPPRPRCDPNAAGSCLWFGARAESARVRAARQLTCRARAFHDRLRPFVRLIPCRCRAAPKLPPPTDPRFGAPLGPIPLHCSSATQAAVPRPRPFLFGRSRSSGPAPNTPAVEERPSRPDLPPTSTKRSRAPSPVAPQGAGARLFRLPSRA
jgi:hypothetical protein